MKQNQPKKNAKSTKDVKSTKSSNNNDSKIQNKSKAISKAPISVERDIFRKDPREVIPGEGDKSATTHEESIISITENSKMNTGKITPKKVYNNKNKKKRDLKEISRDMDNASDDTKPTNISMAPKSKTKNSKSVRMNPDNQKQSKRAKVKEEDK